MKYFIRTISLLVVLNLATASCSAQKDADADEPVESYREILEDRIEEQVLLSMTNKPDMILKNFVRGSARSGTENILVIPAGDMDAQNLGETIEDMNIMSRIFQKDLDQADMLKGRHIWFFWGSQSAGAPRNIYLEGYGALFLMEVDFPLLPLPQAEEKETQEEDVDHVWQQAKREVYQSPNDRHFKIESDDEQEAYDVTKVENLKTRLIKNLKHAANIRNLKSTEWIVIAVTGSGGESAEIHISTGYGRGARSGGRAGGGRAGARGRGGRSGRGGRAGGGGGGGFGGGFAGGLSTKSASATVLTVRATKADVNAFAKGKLDFKQFQKRVRMFTY